MWVDQMELLPGAACARPSVHSWSIVIIDYAINLEHIGDII